MLVASDFDKMTTVPPCTHMDPVYDRNKVYRKDMQNLDKLDAMRECDHDDDEHIDH